jgi:hypothetical protein
MAKNTVLESASDPKTISRRGCQVILNGLEAMLATLSQSEAKRRVRLAISRWVRVRGTKSVL